MSSFNIWRIKNRWKRAVVAWMIGPPVLLGLLVLTVTLSVIDAAWWSSKEMVRRFTDTFNAAEWNDLLPPLWRAMTAREAA